MNALPENILLNQELINKIWNTDITDSAHHCTRMVAYNRLCKQVGIDAHRAVAYVNLMTFKVDQYYWDNYQTEVTNMINKLCDKIANDYRMLADEFKSGGVAFEYMKPSIPFYTFRLQD